MAAFVTSGVFTFLAGFTVEKRLLHMTGYFLFFLGSEFARWRLKNGVLEGRRLWCILFLLEMREFGQRYAC